MARRPEDGRGDLRYFVRFCVTALILVSGTLLLVLVVLPQRFVLSSGFREAGVNFPSPAVPFSPLDPVRVAARPEVGPVSGGPVVGGSVPRGPAEIFWDRVLPLLEQHSYDEALPLFDAYLESFPADDDVRRERVATLFAADRPDLAVPALRDLVGRTGDPELQLLMARTLRDLGRVDEASIEYAELARSRPDDLTLALEWSRALAGVERYDDAERVLLDARERTPGSLELRAELARLYYYVDRLLESRAFLEPLTEDELADIDALELRADIDAALHVPEPELPLAEPPTALERATSLREQGEIEASRDVLLEALRETPSDPALWLAYANLLEYEANDFAGALDALREVERLGAADVDLQLRMALLEVWTGQSEPAMHRLERLLAGLEADPTGVGEGSPVTKAEVRALMGDLRRWEGDRLAALGHYERAVTDDPSNQRAADGEAAIDIEVAIRIDEVERPGMGSRVLGLGDTDDFTRFDAAGEWSGVRDGWVWSGAAGQRWLSGRALAGAPEAAHGPFLDATAARWWRAGTVRASVRVGGEWVREGDPDPSFGAGLQMRPVRGGALRIDYAHEPAYGLTATVQSLNADVTQDRVLAVLDHPLSDLWSLTVQADAARLHPLAVAGAEPSTRLQGALALGRAFTPTWSLGWSASALTYTRPAPAPGGLRLFWDPAAAWSTGPFAAYRNRFSERWAGTLRLAPGLALIDERTPSGLESVPQLSAEARLEYASSRLRTAVEVFYSQARLEGYRSYGLRFSLGTTSWLSQEPGR